MVAHAQQQVPRQLGLEKEAALGNQIASEVRSRTNPVENERVQQYAQRIGRRLTSHVEGPFTWTFDVVTGLSKNLTNEPLSIPGGYIFIPVDLILACQNEDEFAGMLARAIAYDAARGATRSVSANYGTIPLVFVGGIEPVAISRALEREADTRAIHIMRAAGFNPSALMQYVARVQPRAERLAALQAELDGLLSLKSEDSFEVIQNRVRSLTPKPSLLKPEER